ncbi:photosynthetic protein synthase I [Frondihabitans sucicola]|uniref:Photosynthetic protein synthase I n=1 Tax=Frondihabitans sucicola TaxID=1268041 RepID=A0ABN6XVN4_9MICO|nr:SCO family protein [Frondihabitans sucicola]BDZ48846.1 photosynthetic protein synthase I [Frondihabitans sucicola]
MSTDDTITFTLDDHLGRPTAQSSFPGRRSLVFFGFTHCRTVCPRALDRLDRALDLLGEDAAAFQPLYVTVDPDRDDPERMRWFLRDRPRFLGLSGTPRQLEDTRRAFRAFAKRKDDPQDPDGYAVPHTALTYVLDDAGRLLTHLADAMTADEVATALRGVLRDDPATDSIPSDDGCCSAGDGPCDCCGGE